MRTRSCDKTFNGKLVVVVDRESASASEIFAEVVQSEKRGTVVGDLSSGRVMDLKLMPEEAGKLFPVEWPSDGREHGK